MQNLSTAGSLCVCMRGGGFIRRLEEMLMIPAVSVCDVLVPLYSYYK